MAQDAKVEQNGRLDSAQVVLGTFVALSRWVADNAAGPEVHEPTARRSGELRYVALGAASLLEDRLRDAVAIATRAGRTAYGPIAPVADRLIPSFVRQPVTDAVRRLDTLGRTTAAAGADRAARLADAVAEDLAREPIVLHAIEQIVDQLQWRIVDQLLPGVLDRLAAEPEQVRAIVQGQSRGMVDELTETARSRAVEGDEAVDRLLARLLHRKTTRREVTQHPAPQPAPSPATAPLDGALPLES